MEVIPPTRPTGVLTVINIPPKSRSEAGGTLMVTDLRTYMYIRADHKKFLFEVSCQNLGLYPACMSCGGRGQPSRKQRRVGLHRTKFHSIVM